MQAELKLTRTRSSNNQIKVHLKFAFDGNDPTAASIYRGISRLVAEILTPGHTQEFMEKLEKARRNPRGGEISGRVK